VGAVLVAGAVAGCGGSDQKLGSAVRDNFVAGCEQGGQSKTGCECLYKQLTQTQGIDTESKLKKLNDQVVQATKSPNPAAAIPDSFRKAALACKSQF
jgi:hypothetical protein